MKKDTFYRPLPAQSASSGNGIRHRSRSTGSQVITNLARMSMALQALGHPGLHVTVFDPDTVSQANIGRQLFSETELGLNKAVSLSHTHQRSSDTHGLPNRNVFLPGIFLKTAQQISS